LFDITLFSQIHLDSETCGLNLPGSANLIKTIEYLNKYIDTSHPAPLRSLLLNLDEQARKISSIHNPVYHSEVRLTEEVEHFCQSHAKKIQYLDPKSTILLTSYGWYSPGNSKDKIISQFTGHSEGILCSIYNSGNGLEEHEAFSAEDGERFYPVMQYLIPKPINEAELRQFIKSLVRLNSRFLSDRVVEEGHEDQAIYRAIKFYMQNLKAEKLLVSKTIDRDLTTRGKLSGKSAQSVLNQVLKIYFKNLSEYQEFILGFKIFSLRECLQDPSDLINNPSICRLIALAIDNSLKISNRIVGANADRLAGELIQLKTKLRQIPEPLQSALATEGPKSTEYQVLPTSLKAKQPEDSSVYRIKRRAKDRAAAYAHGAASQNIVQPKLLPLNDAETLLPTLERLLTHCQEQSKKDPFCVLTEIEACIMQLPIPQGGVLPALYATVVGTYEQIEKMNQLIENIQKLYAGAYTALLGYKQFPHLFAIIGSFLVLRAYFEKELSLKKPAAHVGFHPFIEGALREVLSGVEHSPYLATNHPEFDQRIKELYAYLEQDQAARKASEKREAIPGLSLRKHYEKIIQCTSSPVSPLNKKAWEFFSTKSEERAAPQRRSSFEPQNLDHLLPEAISNAGSDDLKILWYFMHSWYAYDSKTSKISNVPEETKELAQKIQTQLVLEQFTADCIALLSGKEPLIQRGVRPKLVYRDDGSSDSDCVRIANTPLSPTLLREEPREFPENYIIEQQYPLLPSAAKDVLSHYSFSYYDSYQEKTANEIQLTQEPAHRRLWLFTTEKAAHQLILTIDYYLSLVRELTDPNLQSYFRANIFQFRLLRAELEKSPEELIAKFHKFVKKGLVAFPGIGGLLSHTALFFIQLTAYFDRYVARYNPALDPERLTANVKLLTQLIEVNQRDPEILASLHRYRFLMAIDSYQYTTDPNDDRELFAKIYYSYFYMQAKANTHVKDDAVLLFEIERAKHKFASLIHKALLAEADFLENCISAILKDLGFEFDRLTQEEGNYFHFEDTARQHVFRINYLLGKIEDAHGFIYSPIPRELKENPLLAYLGLQEETSCFLEKKPSRPHYEGCYCLLGKCRFVQAQTQIEITLLAPDMGNESEHASIEKSQIRYVVTRKFGEHIYSLDCLLETQAKTFQLYEQEPSIDERSSLPKFLTQDGSVQLWNSRDSHQLLFTSGQIPVYHARQEADADHSLKRVDESLQPLARLTSVNPVHALTAQFESANFTEILQNNDPNTVTIRFLRYGISLLVSKDPATIFLSGTQDELLLDDDAAPHFSSEVACLKFTDGKTPYCIVAVQPFYAAEEQSVPRGAYFSLAHDTTNTIASSYIAEKYADKKKQPQPFWVYQNSESMIKYPIVSGKLKADSPADALYLCYLYLATHQPEKAWSLLEDLQQSSGLIGTFQELLYLSWIIDKLPANLFSEHEAEAPRNTAKTLRAPQYIACQLKALALLTHLLTLGKKIEFSNPHPYDLTTANGIYQKHCFTEVKYFYENFSLTIAHLYQFLQIANERMPNTSVSYELTREEKISLLKYCRCDKHPSLGYEKLYLTIESLVMYEQKLMSLPGDSREASEQIAANRALVREKIDCLPTAKGHATVVEKQLVPINYLNYEAEPVKSFNINNIGNPDEAKEKLTLLRSSITQKDLAGIFSYLASIALSGSQEDQQALISFCQNYLVSATEYISEEKQNTAERYLVTILYQFALEPFAYSDNISFIKFCKLIKPNQDTIAQVAIEATKHVQTETYPTPRQIYDQLYREIAVFEKLSVSEIASSSAMVIDLEEHAGLKSFYENYKGLEARYQEQRYRIISAEESSADSEDAVGRCKYELLEQQRELARAYFSSEGVLTEVTQIVTRQEQRLRPALDNAWDACVTLSEKTLRKKYGMQYAAEQRQSFTKEDLLKLYVHSSEALYAAKTELRTEDIKELHKQIHDCMKRELQCQQLCRLKKELDDESPKDVFSYQRIADILVSENHPIAQCDPDLMVLQYKKNILLRPRQAEAIKDLLATDSETGKTQDRVEKIFMGDGKTTVLTPVWARKKANGTHLVIVEELPNLLYPTHDHLNKTSQELYGQSAYCFEFDREKSDCSVAGLQKIYDLFFDTMVGCNYLVTTNTAIPSLALKLIELQLKGKEGQQIVLFKKILKLCGKKHGAALLDEVHETLLLRNKLTYGLGDRKPISQDIIGHSIELYNFIIHLAAQKFKTEHLQTVSLCDQVKYYWPQVLADLATELVQNVASPLRQYRAQIAAQPAEIIAYLCRTSTDELRTSDLSAQEALEFYQKQVALLPITLRKKCEVDYGPSESGKKDALQRALAIPYSANKKPKESNEFGTPEETLNYTIQSLCVMGVTSELLKKLISQWKQTAQSELTENYSSYPEGIDQTPTGQGIAALLAGFNDHSGLRLTLRGIELSNADQLKQLTLYFQGNKTVIFTLLESYIFPQIEIEAAIISSTSANHAGIYRSVQGFSGTPRKTYHQRFGYNPLPSLGTDGHARQVLTSKGTKIQGVPFNTLPEFLSQLDLTVCDAAIIDVSATFAGISNIQVAKKLADQLQKKNPKIRYILYFNSENRLCALLVRDQEAPAIILSNTDESTISEKLSCSPEERFTYYDHARTTGTDITQPLKSCGIVLLQKDTLADEYWQGAMRMRKLQEQQTVRLIVPQELSAMSLEDLLKMMDANQRVSEQKDLRTAALENMDNVIRAFFWQRMLDLDDASGETDKKWMANALFRAYFVQENIHDFETRRALQVRRRKSFADYKKMLIEEWRTAVNDLGMSGVEEQQVLEAELNKIIEAASAYANSHRDADALDYGQELEREEEEEEEKEEELEHQCEQEPGKQKLIAVKYVSCAEQDPAQTQLAKALRQELSKDSIFSYDLYVSNNYKDVFEGQMQLLGPHLKPVDLVYFKKDESGSLTACVITINEAMELQQVLSNPSNTHPLRPFLSAPCHFWISTTQHAVRFGAPPENYLKDPAYCKLMEQIRFFDGKLTELLDDETPMAWLREESQAKLTYATNHIFSHRKTLRSDIKVLSDSLFGRSKALGFGYISANAFNKDLSSVNWQKICGQKLPASDLADYKFLIAAIIEANKNFQAEVLTIDRFSGYYLSPTAIHCLQQHIDYLNSLRTQIVALVQDFQENPDKFSNFQTIDPSHKKILDIILQINLVDRFAAYQTRPEAVDQFEQDLAQIEILYRLLASPIMQDSVDFTALIFHTEFFAKHHATINVTAEMILLTLLELRDKRITEKHFAEFQAYDPQTQRSILAQLRHPHITAENIDPVLEKVSSESLDEVIPLINELHSKGKLNRDQHRERIIRLIKKHYLIFSEETGEKTDALISSLMPFLPEIWDHIQTSATNETTKNKILIRLMSHVNDGENHEFILDFIRNLLIRYAPDELLPHVESVFTKCTNYAFINHLFRGMIAPKEAGTIFIFPDRLYSSIFRSEKIDAVHILPYLIHIQADNKKIIEFMEVHHERLREDQWEALIDYANNGELLKAILDQYQYRHETIPFKKIAQHPQCDQSLLLVLVNRAPDPQALGIVLRHATDQEVYVAIIESRHFNAELCLALINKEQIVFTRNMLKSFFVGFSDNDEIFKKILQHCSLADLRGWKEESQKELSDQQIVHCLTTLSTQARVFDFAVFLSFTTEERLFQIIDQNIGQIKENLIACLRTFVLALMTDSHQALGAQLANQMSEPEIIPEIIRVINEYWTADCTAWLFEVLAASKANSSTIIKSLEIPIQCALLEHIFTLEPSRKTACFSRAALEMEINDARDIRIEVIKRFVTEWDFSAFSGLANGAFNNPVLLYHTMTPEQALDFFNRAFASFKAEALPKEVSAINLLLSTGLINPEDKRINQKQFAKFVIEKGFIDPVYSIYLYFVEEYKDSDQDKKDKVADFTRLLDATIRDVLTEYRSQAQALGRKHFGGGFSKFFGAAPGRYEERRDLILKLRPESRQEVVERLISSMERIAQKFSPDQTPITTMLRESLRTHEPNVGTHEVLQPS
jgi:hypothetical protein